MSSTSLTTYLRTPGKEIPSKPVPLPSVDVPHGIKTSKNSDVLTMLYGTRDTVEEISRVHKVAKLENERVHRCSVKVEIGYWQAGPVGMDILPDIKFLCLHRVKLDVADAIVVAVKANLRRGEARYRAELNRDGLDVVCRNPFLLDRLREDDQFRHIAVIAYDTQGADRQVRLANVYPNAEILEIDVRSTKPIEFVVPKGFTAESLLETA